MKEGDERVISDEWDELLQGDSISRKINVCLANMGVFNEFDDIERLSEAYNQLGELIVMKRLKGNEQK